MKWPKQFLWAIPGLWSEVLCVWSEREKQERVRQAELVRARSTITQLESRVGSLNTALKHAAIEHQKAVDSLKLEHEVIH